MRSKSRHETDVNVNWPGHHVSDSPATGPQPNGRHSAGGWGPLLRLAGAGVAAWGALRLWRTFHAYDLAGKNVVITGGSRGLGLVLARELLRHGARVAICARDAEELQLAFDDLAPRGRTVAVTCDVTQPEQVRLMLQIVRDRLGEVDVLVNNAGAISVGPIETMTLQDYHEMMRVHFWGPLYAILEVLPSMRRRGQGRIVNITSIGGKLSMPHLVPYGASKFALVGLSEGLRAELAKDGIVVTTVCPGLMRTDSPRHGFFKGKHRAEYAWFSVSDSLPLGSMSAERAARQIVAACKRGDAEVVLSLPAKAAAAFHGLFPGLTADILGLVNRLLPGPGGIGTQKREGKDSTSAVAPSVLTALSDSAAVRNNELVDTV
jgi:NAD(P)-dependent dehydrogenase (short-subunit alcohol dehydrogenase family)